ncbi:MAG: tubulin-like doman-containing protein [Gracilibacteraceae bacterium]|jgi:hypothetical protein|nr:tubulin-like doman-containing protein [Gracilibacteraceae bacterium]
MLTDAQRDRINANFQKLDYVDGGLLTGKKRDIVDQRFLLVGYGGTGGKALARLRELLRQNVRQTEIDAKARFCAIDADHSELDRLVHDGVFAADEVFRIPYIGARESIHPGHIAPALRPWVNPRLYTPAGLWNGTGAVRQMGRVLLSLPNSVTSLVERLTAQINLLDGANGRTKLNVFILTGIAGGTGGGIVVDATYIIRQICDNVIGDPARLSVAGYVFLPPAGPDAPSASNNANGYAALKEIDYHMTVHQRSERYQHTYADLRVDQEDIFDFCALIDGRADGKLFRDHDKAALNVAANSILDMMTTEDKSGADDDAKFLVTSLLSNTTAAAEAFVASRPAHDCPREANYRYAIIGCQRMTLPIKLLRLHVTLHAARLLFQLLGDQHTDSLTNATQQAAQGQLNAFGLDTVDGLRERIRARARYPHIPDEQVAIERADAAGREVGNEILANIRNFARTAFRDDSRGPAYTVSMLDHMYNELNDPNTGLRQLDRQANGRDDKEQMEFKWAQLIILRAMEVILYLKSGAYEVMKEIIKQLKKVLDASEALLTEFQGEFRNMHEWSLVDISNGPAANHVIKDYLEGLVDPEDFKPKRKMFLEELLDRCAELATGADGDIFRLKNFIQTSFREFFGELIDASLEDFLVKLFTGDPQARADTGNPDADRAAIQQAVDNFIVTRLDASLPMASTGGKLAVYDQAAKRYLTFPRKAEHIGAALKAALGDGYHYYPSAFDDSIGFLQVYTGIPAFLFSWTADGQEAYEANIGMVGLHMNEGAPVEGESNWEKNWRRFPALRADAPHEIRMRAEAEDLFRRAEELGLTRVDADDDYYLTLLQPGVDIDALRASIDFGGAAIDLPGLGTALREARPARMYEKKLEFGNMVKTFDPDPFVPAPVDWRRGLAVKILRKRLEMIEALDGTLKVLDELVKEVDDV